MKKRRLLSLLMAGILIGVTACGSSSSSSSSSSSDSSSSEETTEEAEEAEEETAEEETAEESTDESAEEESGGLLDNLSHDEKVEYDILISYSTAATTLDSDTDVVTPYVEALFNVEVGEITQLATSDISFKQTLAARIAAGNEPDVIIASSENIAYAISTGMYGDNLEQYIEEMDNMNKYMDEDAWSRYIIDGKKVQIPCVAVNTTTEEYTSDPYNVPMTSWALWTREDLLEACGYSFTPLSEIEAEYEATGELPTAEDFAIEPAIDTPEALAEYLQKIKDLGITVGDVEMTPMSIISWSQFHVGSMFETGHWMIESDGEVNGFLGCSGTEDYYRWLNQLYNDGLIDPDFLIQTDDQLQAKVAQGLVGVGMYIPDKDSAQQVLLESNEDAVIRYIPWPKEEGTDGGYYDLQEAGYWRVTVANDFEYTDRLCEMWDWLFSDEGLDILTWGPEGTGVWEYDEDGVKKFVDPETEAACLGGIMDSVGADYYGLYDWTGVYFPFMSTIAICSPQLNNYNPMSYTRSYEASVDISTLNQSYSFTGGYDFEGRASYGDGSDTVAEVSSYYWSDWAGTDSAEVIACDPEDFDSVYEAAVSNFLEETNYDAAKEVMEEWFETYSSN